MKLEFAAAIHDTPAALRFGSDEAYITLVVPACDVEKVVPLIALKKTPLRVSVEVVTDGETKGTAGGERKSIWT